MQPSQPSQTSTSGSLMAASTSIASPAVITRSTLPKPQTPGSTSNGKVKPSSEKKVKPTFTSSLTFPETKPEPVPFLAAGDTADLNRSQRRSKVEALTKLDRAGTPVQITSSGPAATSFIPRTTEAGPSVPSGPSINRNPLHRPAVVNPPFDIASVRTTAPRQPPSRAKSRLFGLEECPSYYPTIDEFQNPMRYIDSIAEEAKAYGICKIIPPEGWQMPFVLDSSSFQFRTRLQRLNSLEATSRAKVNFLEQLTMYQEQADARLVIPQIDRRDLDLYQLRKAVNKIGGHEEVNRMKGWPIIAKTLGYDEKYAHVIKSNYLRLILPFDTFASGRRSNSGSPLTPMPSTAASKPPGFLPDSPASPTRPGRMGTTRSASSAAAIGSHLKLESPLADKALSLRATSLKAASPSEMPVRPASATPSLGTTIKIKVPGFSRSEGSESELSDEDLQPPPKLPSEHQKGEVCEVCQRGDDGAKILLCDACDKGFHIYCLNPPLSFVPTNEEWYCGPCLFAQGDGYGFDEGEDHSIASFRARDAAFANAWWAKHRPSSSVPESTSRRLGEATVTEDDVEREFWRLTEDANDTVEIEYGADVHSTTHGSGSPSLETHPLNPYAKDGWNLNNMPIVDGSLLRYIKSDVSGMTVPWIYVGMLFSAFCWHNEDHFTYSVNYMHWGETKTWYGIPGADADKFEDAMKAEAPDLFEQQPSLLYQLVTMMNPGKCAEAGVKVVACDQRPNEFVITFPKAYHCGFNHGINFNEAVNFALPDWLPDGKECVVRYKQHAKPPVFSHNELLITITLWSDTIETALWVQDSLKEMVTEETARRARLRSEVPMITEHLVEEDCPEEQYQCCICKGFCYLSQVTCNCTKLVACVDHADQLCGCPKLNRTLRKRYSEAQLEEILAAVQNRAMQPENWRSRFESLLTVPRPPLKSLRAILAEGEKIAYPMSEIHDLRAIVGRANTWVEKVTTLLTRKSTGRRRKGRQGEDEEELDRSPTALLELLKEAERLAFDAPEILTLRQLLSSIEDFKRQAFDIASTPDIELNLDECFTIMVLGESLNIDLPELATVQTTVNRLEWFKKVEEDVDDRTLQLGDVFTLLEDAEKFEIPSTHPTVVELNSRKEKGLAWKTAVDHLLSSPSIELDDISALIEGQELVPTSLDDMRQLENIRKTAQTWQSTAVAQLSNGSSNAAQRLCRTVKMAQGPVARVRLPEIAVLQDELDFHAEWQRDLADALNVPAKQVSVTLTNIRRAVEQHLHPDDNAPSDQYTCFCRTPPAPNMVTCISCQGNYHPRCVDVAPKNINNPFTCAMCGPASYDDRPSLDAIAVFTDTHRFRFRIPPGDLDTLSFIVSAGSLCAAKLVPIVDPLSQAAICRDVELLSHWARKLFNLPVALDAVNSATKQRIKFEDWLYKRMHDAQHPTKAKTRARKPKLVLKQAKEGEFACVCDTPPYDAAITLDCVKCGQGYHATCVDAPLDCLGQDAKNWRCPCCTVKEGKRYQQGGPTVRVQMSDRLGTDTFVDYRTTINTWSDNVLEYKLPKTKCILLECTKMIPPIIPEGFVPPTMEQVRATRFEDNNDDIWEGRRKRRKTDAQHAASSPAPAPAPATATNGTNGTAASGTNGIRREGDTAGNTMANGHGSTPPQSDIPRTATGYSTLPPGSQMIPQTATIHGPRTILDLQPAQSRSPANHPFGAPPQTAMSYSPGAARSWSAVAASPSRPPDLPSHTPNGLYPPGSSFTPWKNPIISRVTKTGSAHDPIDVSSDSDSARPLPVPSSAPQEGTVSSAVGVTGGQA